MYIGSGLCIELQLYAQRNAFMYKSCRLCTELKFHA
jgi:hypothetical protein